MSESTSQLAAAAARHWDLPAPQLLRRGSNDVYTAGHDVLLRVGVPAHDFDSDLAIHEMLAAHGVRTPRPMATYRGADSSAIVTAVEHVEQVGMIEWSAVGSVVRRLHSVPVQGLDLPSCTTFAHWQFETVLSEVEALIDPVARVSIDRCLDRWSDWPSDATRDVVFCHGDLHPGNVLNAVDGPVLIDLDLRCLAPVAWDHSALLTWEHRWNADPGTYAAFAAGYGTDLPDDRVGTEFAELRLLAATLMRLRATVSNPAARAEAELRLRWWRGDAEAPRWTPQ